MIQARAGYTHNGRRGWLVCGRNDKGQRVRIFVEHVQALHHIKQKARAGEPIEPVDFHHGRAVFGAEAYLLHPYLRTMLP